MNKTDVVIVVLHYQTITETIETVESIEEHIGDCDYKIVVVDNGSPNNTGKQLDEYFSFNERVEVLKTNENLGFAKGNNVGYAYAKEIYDPNFIILSNNDILLITDDFYRILKDEYSRSPFAILGPMIITADGRCDSNPIAYSRLSKAKLQSQLKDAKFHYYLNELHLLNVYSFLSRVKHIVRPQKTVSRKTIDYQDGVTLHGSFLVFSRDYIKNMNGLNPSTFMYKEEYFLKAEADINNFRMVYCPRLLVFHYEDAATNSIQKGNYNKNKFVFGNIVESTQKLIQFYEEHSLQ